MQKNSFDAISFCYDALAEFWFGKAIAESQVVFFNMIPENAKILIIGGGTGKILEEIAKMNKNLSIDYIEYSSEMLRKARARNAKTDSVNFILGDEGNIKYENHYDVVITSYFLDLFEKERLENVIERLFKSLKANGYWQVVDFYLDEKSSFMQRGTVWLMYKFFGIFCNIEARHLMLPDPFFECYLLNKTDQKFFFENLIRSTVWQKKD